MILISHRGNTQGIESKLENKPSFIDRSLNMGYDVEVDIWLNDGKLYLGHDLPQFLIDEMWLAQRINQLWIHCKNIDSIIHFNKSTLKFNYFFHESDKVTLTSKNFIWAYPGNQPIEKSIAVLPEIHNENLSKCIGICSDYIKKYKNLKYEK